jgi:phosphoserine phosphatase RsbU/P
VLDTSNLRLTYSRAGHPEAVLIRRDGAVLTLPGPGSLLGVFPEEQYTSSSIDLTSGDRLVLFSDGLEDALTDPSGEGESLTAQLASLKGVARDEMLLQLTAWIDARSGTGRAADDVTVVVMDVG